MQEIYKNDTSDYIHKQNKNKKKKEIIYILQSLQFEKEYCPNDNEFPFG